MLVLTRGEGDEILIGDNIRILVVEVRSAGQVRIGIDAPRDVQIVRPDAKNKKPKAWQP